MWEIMNSCVTKAKGKKRNAVVNDDMDTSDSAPTDNNLNLKGWMEKRAAQDRWRKVSEKVVMDGWTKTLTEGVMNG